MTSTPVPTPVSTLLRLVPAGSYSLADLRRCNLERQAAWCAGGTPTPDLSYRGNELAGEAGEAAEALLLHLAELTIAAGKTSNVVKKLERERHGWRGSRASLDDLASELADTVICADLAAATAGIDLQEAVRAKFDETSEKVGLTTKLTDSPWRPVADRPPRNSAEYPVQVWRPGWPCVSIAWHYEDEEFQGREPATVWAPMTPPPLPTFTPAGDRP